LDVQLLVARGVRRKFWLDACSTYLEVLAVMLRPAVILLVAVALATGQTQTKQSSTPGPQMSMGALAVTTDHEGWLFVDGERKLPIVPDKVVTFRVTAGQHFVDLRDAKGMKLWQKVVEVPSGKQAAVQIQRGSGIGRIDVMAAILSTHDSKKAASDMQAKYDPTRSKIQQMQTALARLELQLQSQVGESRRDTESQVNKLRESLKATTDSTEAEIKVVQEKISQELRLRMMAVLRAYAKETGLRMVVDSDQNTLFVAEGVSEADFKKDSATDITQDVVARYEDNAAPSTQTQSTTDIGGQIDEVARSGRYTALPPPQAVGAGGPGGQPSLSIGNRTAYDLTILMSGPVQRSIAVPPGMSRLVALPPGSYRLLGRVSAPNVLPFFGTQTYSSGVSYSESFYIQ
jgi:Skp family chaperone for outer membrane proteins